MKDFYFRVTVIAMGLCFPGTVTTPARKSSIFHNSEYQWDEHLLANRSSIRQASQVADTLGMSSRFFRVLFQSHTRKKWQIKHLDLSNRSISRMTLSPLAPFHALEILNLSSNAMHSLLLDLPPPRPSQQKHPRSLRSRLPLLKVLILQRNQLSGTPKGLWKLKSLQSLDLSFNRIVHVGTSDFHHCLQLESIYLKSNNICTIHPEAFKDLKKLQLVDLRSNALTTLAPIVIIALEFPHLELDLADNQWQCGKGNASFQNVTSASWRKKWNAICNMFVENEKPYLETSQIRIPRDTHLPPTLSDMKSLMQSKAERPQEGRSVHLPTLEKEAQMDNDDLKVIWPQSSTELRDSQDEHVTDRRNDDSPDLTLAICLSVFITFVVAFCLGAFVRPYLDKLWQQRCLSKRPGLENAYSNEGFYDEVEASQRVPHQGTEWHHTSNHPNLYERRNPSWVTEPTPHDAVMSERVLGDDRMDLSSQQSPVQLESSTGTTSRDCSVLPSSHAVHHPLCGLPNADTHELTSAVQGHYHVPEELHYDTVAQEYSVHEGVMDGSPIALLRGTVPNSINNGCGELCLSQSRDAVVPVSKTLVPANTQEPGERKERGCPEPLGTVGSLMESSKEGPVSNSIRGLGPRQPSSQEDDAEERFSDVYDEVLYNDPRDGCDELCLSQSRDAVVPVSKSLVPMNTQRAGERKERGCPEPLGTVGSPVESSEERPVSNSVRGLGPQQPSSQEEDAEERFSDVYDEVLYNDPRDGCDELCLSQSRDVVAPVSKSLVPANTQEPGERKERGCPEPLGTVGSPVESSEERPVSNSIRGLSPWQPSSQEEDAEERFSDVYDEVLYNDPRAVDSPSLMPRWGSDPHITPATEEPALRGVPFDPLYDLITNYESDSDEGSLFTLSSEASEDLPEEQASVENGGATKPLPSRNWREYKDHVTSVLSDEDITSQRILKKCEHQEALFENPLISGPESFV